MSELITVTTNSDNEQVLSARELYKALEVKQRFSVWFETNKKYFIEGVDFTSVKTGTVVNNGAVKPIQDYSLTLDMGKQVSMMSRTENGKQVRQYFIEVEKQFNSPEMMMARSLQYANQKMLQYDQQIKELSTTIKEQAPKVEFADAITASEDTVSIGTLAKLVTQAGFKIGRNSLFAGLRDTGYLISSGEDYNMPAQKGINLGLFEVHTSVYGDHISRKTVVTPKGQQYFINKLLTPEDVA